MPKKDNFIALNDLDEFVCLGRKGLIDPFVKPSIEDILSFQQFDTWFFSVLFLDMFNDF